MKSYCWRLKTEKKMRPFHFTDIHNTLAAKYGLVLLIRHLIEYGVAPIEVDENGKTAAHYAMEKGRVNALRLLAPYFPLERADIPNPYFSRKTEADLNTLFAADFPMPSSLMC